MNINDFGDILFPYDVMMLLGIGKNTFLKLVHSGELKGFRVGKKWRVLKTDLLDFIRK